MVAVDEQGKSKKLPALECRDDLERYRFEEAKLCKQHSMAMQEEHANHKARVRGGLTS